MKRASRRSTLRRGLYAGLVLAVGLAQPWNWTLLAQAPQVSTGVRFAEIAVTDMQEWLGYLASDELQGRRVFTEGYGLAAAYVADHLKDFGVKPLGDNGSYFQTVERVGYRVTNNSSITVSVNGESRTFKHGDHVTFSEAAGGAQTLNFNTVEFAGYGMVNLDQNYDDFGGRDVEGKLVFWMPGTPQILQAAGGGGRTRNRSNFIRETYNTAGILQFTPAPAPPSPEVVMAQEQVDRLSEALTVAQTQLQAARAAGRGGGGRGGRGAQTAATPDLTSVFNMELTAPPIVTGDEAFFDFLFSGSADGFTAIRARAEAGEALAPLSLINVSATITIDNDYEVMTTELAKNVVGMVEGSDPTLRDTYVMFGAHLDHTGYRTSAGGGRGGGRGAAAPAGPPDLINNGADDDGSGSTALMGIAKALATGPKPLRSTIFVWHTAEESGLLGSRYMADHMVVPIEQVQAQFNIDMIGRNRDDDEAMSNTVFVIGADRISTDLHNIVVDTNDTLASPVTLDYEYNDPSDTNSFYTRSDHYSYAAKGIPIAFFFTGTHPDYHQPGDHADKIVYPKLTKIAQLVYQAGFNIANSRETLERDNKGPRSGRGFSGKIVK